MQKVKEKNRYKKRQKMWRKFNQWQDAHWAMSLPKNIVHAIGEVVDFYRQKIISKKQLLK